MLIPHVIRLFLNSLIIVKASLYKNKKMNQVTNVETHVKHDELLIFQFDLPLIFFYRRDDILHIILPESLDNFNESNDTSYLKTVQ